MIKKIFKGCLISILVFILIVTGIYFYSTSPNDIKIEDKSFSVKEYNSELDFPKGNLPSFILEANNEDILYQAYVMKNFGAECTYVCVIKPAVNSIKLENILPLKTKQLNKLNSLLQFNKIESTFNPVIKLPENMETEPGINVRVFNPNFNEKLNVNSGMYQYEVSKSIDKEGYYNEIIIYDRNSNLLYYERMRFHAWQ
jgi:hypothetical protein